MSARARARIAIDAADDQRRGEREPEPAWSPPARPAGRRRSGAGWSPTRYIVIASPAASSELDGVAGQEEARSAARTGRRRARAGRRRPPPRAPPRTRGRGAARGRGRRPGSGSGRRSPRRGRRRDAVPSTYGSASGLRSSPWKVAPGDRQPAADHDRRQDARQAQLQDDRLGCRGPRPLDRQADRAEQDPEGVAGRDRRPIPAATARTTTTASTPMPSERRARRRPEPRAGLADVGPRQGEAPPADGHRPVRRRGDAVMAPRWPAAWAAGRAPG